MNIAICDDEKFYIEEVVKIIDVIRQQYADINICVQTFLSSQDLVNDIIHHEKHYDIILLDIQMDDLNGIEATKIIRQTDMNVNIIFISGIVRNVTNAIRAGGSGFIIKENIYEDLEEELKYTIDQLIHKQNLYYSVMFNGEKLDIKVDDITFIEVKMKKLDIHMRNAKIIKVVGKIKEARGKLETYGFVSPHNSFIVNCKYIKEFRKNDILLLTNDIIPIAQGKHKKTYNEYLKYELGWE